MTMPTRGRARTSRGRMWGAVIVKGDWAVSVHIENGGLRWDQNIADGRTTTVQDDVDVRSDSCLDRLYDWRRSSVDT